MHCVDFHENIVIPGLSLLEGITKIPSTPEARAMLTAIGGQEGGWENRVQMGGGPAHSFWQFERAGGVRGVLAHPTSHPHVIALCLNLQVAPTEMAIWEEMAVNDDLGCGMARLLLLTDPSPLLREPDVNPAWDCYLRNWRPGKPREGTWASNWANAWYAEGVLRP